MVDPRIYRAGLGLLLFAVVVFAFSLTPPPPPAGTNVSPGTFLGSAPATMESLYRAFPARPPGSSADDRLAARVAGQLASIGGFAVTSDTDIARTTAGTEPIETVIASRSAVGTGAIVVIAPRDGPGPAGLSGTAVLLGLARALGGATLTRPVMLISTSGTVGTAGIRAILPQLTDQPVDAVITLGDLAGARLDRPVVLPWGSGDALAPPALFDTVTSFVASQAGIPGTQPGFVSQLAHEVVPFALGGQAPLLAAGIPAVGLSTAGARWPNADEPLRPARVAGLGAAVLQSVDALEAAPDIAAPSPYLTISGQSVPLWAVRLLTLALILPVAATVVDALARARRRGHPLLSWLAWVVVGAVPFLLAGAAAILAGLTGALAAAPPGPVAGGVPLTPRGGAVLALVAAVLLVGGYGRRWMLRRLAALRPAHLRAPQTPAIDGAAVALCVFGCGLALVVWAINPFAALLLAPALHAWLWMADGAVRARRAVVGVLAIVAVAPLLAVAGFYMWSLGLSPLGLLWSGLLWVAGRGLSPAGTVYGALLLGAFVSAGVLALGALRRAPEPEPTVTVRGPATYAGPGSLGGTESALRR